MVQEEGLPFKFQGFVGKVVVLWLGVEVLRQIVLGLGGRLEK